MKLRKGDPIIDRLERDLYLETDARQLWVRNHQVAKHFNPALQ